MAFDEELARRVRQVLASLPDVEERKMFGGLAFLIRGNMCCGNLGDALIVRLGPDGAARALREPHTRPFDVTGRPMKSIVTVAPEGYAGGGRLKGWVNRGADFADGLPPK